MAKYEYKVKGVDYVVEIQDIEGNIANVTVNGIPFEVEMKQPVKSSKQKVKLTDGQNNISASSVASAGSAAGSSSAASSDSASSSKQATPAAGKPVVAPLPGTINEIKVKVGDKVNTRRYCCRSRSHEDAEQHRCRNFGNHYQHQREQGRRSNGRRHACYNRVINCLDKS